MKLKKLIQTGVLSLAVLSAGTLSSILSPVKAEAEAAGLTE